MARNRRNQSVNRNAISMKISKELQAVADEFSIRVKPIIRDTLEDTLRHNLYESYTPATEQGKEIQTYNQTHKHQKKQSYHHTGLLARSVYGTIEGNTIKINIKPAQYDDGASTVDVYNYLKFGTSPISKKSDVYSYNGGSKFSQYISQSPHNFETRTREEMKIFLNELLQRPERYVEGKYAKKIK